MNKAYQKINWENEPSEKTPINEENLGKIDNALDEHDNRIITLDLTKAGKSEIANNIIDITLDSKTGIFTFTRMNGSAFTLDTLLEKIVINFGYDTEKQKLTIYQEDGSVIEADLSALITQYEFSESETICWKVSSDGKVAAEIKKGSVTEELLVPNYLALITVQAQNASNSERSAKQSEDNAAASEKLARQHAEEARQLADDWGLKPEDFKEDIEANKTAIENLKSEVETNTAALGGMSLKKVSRDEFDSKTDAEKKGTIWYVY